MSTDYDIGRGERPIIEHFIKQNNKLDWLANISKALNKRDSGVKIQIKSLKKKGILVKQDCPSDLIPKRKRGGAPPHDCFALNYDMKPEWFVEITRPHLNTEDKNARKRFVRSDFTFGMIHYEKFIDWIIENRIKLSLSDDEKNALPIIFISFPSTFRWALFGDVSILDKFLKRDKIIKDKESESIRKLLFASFLNSIIVDDIINEAYLIHKDMIAIEHQSETLIHFLNVKLKEKEEGEMIQGYGVIPGAFGIKFKDIEIKNLGEEIRMCNQCKSVLIWIPQIERYYCEKCGKIRGKRRKRK